jgi:hypothetical protein
MSSIREFTCFHQKKLRIVTAGIKIDQGASVKKQVMSAMLFKILYSPSKPIKINR